MDETPYTHAMWRVQEAREDEFVRAWSELSEVFSRLPAAPLWGTLLRSITDPQLFYSFGPWPSLEAVEAMRADPRAREALERLRALCVEATPGAYRLVRHVDVRQVASGG